MKRKMQFLLFALIISFIILIIIFASVNVKKDKIENTENKVNVTARFDAISTTVLPPGSTSADLQTAINNSNLYDTILISSNIEFSDAVIVPKGKVVNIQSSGYGPSNSWVLSQSKASTRHFLVYGNLTISGITIDGNNLGGGIYVDENSFLCIGYGAILQNNTADLRRWNLCKSQWRFRYAWR